MIYDSIFMGKLQIINKNSDFMKKIIAIFLCIFSMISVQGVDVEQKMKAHQKERLRLAVAATLNLVTAIGFLYGDSAFGVVPVCTAAVLQWQARLKLSGFSTEELEEYQVSHPESDLYACIEEELSKRRLDIV